MSCVIPYIKTRLLPLFRSGIICMNYNANDYNISHVFWFVMQEYIVHLLKLHLLLLTLLKLKIRRALAVVSLTSGHQMTWGSLFLVSTKKENIVVTSQGRIQPVCATEQLLILFISTHHANRFSYFSHPDLSHNSTSGLDLHMLTHVKTFIKNVGSQDSWCIL